MASDDPHFRLRLPQILKEQIEASARSSRRSINSEIVHRLTGTFEGAAPARSVFHEPAFLTGFLKLVASGLRTAVAMLQKLRPHLDADGLHELDKFKHILEVHDQFRTDRSGSRPKRGSKDD